MEGFTETMMNLRVTQSSGGAMNRGVACGVPAAAAAAAAGGAPVAAAPNATSTTGMLLEESIGLGAGLPGGAGAPVLSLGGAVGAVSASENSILGPPSSPSGLRYTSDKHPKLALTNINMLQKRRELCDVVLMVGSRKIFAHRFVFEIFPLEKALYTSNFGSIDFYVPTLIN